MKTRVGNILPLNLHVKAFIACYFLLIMNRHMSKKPHKVSMLQRFVFLMQIFRSILSTSCFHSMNFKTAKSTLHFTNSSSVHTLVLTFQCQLQFNEHFNVRSHAHTHAGEIIYGFSRKCFTLFILHAPATINIFFTHRRINDFFIIIFFFILMYLKHGAFNDSRKSWRFCQNKFSFKQRKQYVCSRIASIQVSFLELFRNCFCDMPRMLCIKISSSGSKNF